MDLIIAEKPSVAKDIAESLGGFAKRDGFFERADAAVVGAVGHLLKLAVPEGVDRGSSLHALPLIPPYFDVAPIETSEDRLNAILKLIKRRDVTRLVNACDAGREGELIFRFIVKFAGTTKPVHRMWLQSMTPEAIRVAYQDMQRGENFAGLHDAAVCRAEADWLVGINATRGFSKRSEIIKGERDLVTAGRVQTPVLTLVVNRELARRAFKPRSFWNLVGSFEAEAGTYDGVWNDPEFRAGDDENAKPDRFFEKSSVDALVAELAGKSVTAVEEMSEEVRRNPPRLFDLTALQREANGKLGLSAKQTLDVAQGLYEKHKVLTYPRTGSTALPEDYLPTVQRIFGVVAGLDNELATHAQRAIEAGYLRQDKRIFDNSKITDHFAIVPTGTEPQGLSEVEQKVFRLVVGRFIAAFFPVAKFEKTVRTTWVGKHSFLSGGKVMKDAGWLAVELDGPEDGDGDLPAVAAGELPAIAKVAAKESKTKAPPSYTESTLLAAMESAGRFVDNDEAREAMKICGLGTPATRAAIIEGLLADMVNGKPKEPYLVREKQALVPTEKGITTIAFLRNSGVELLCSPAMTGDWEKRLGEIERGKETRERFMSDIKEMVSEMIATIRTQTESLPQYAAAVMRSPCPACGGEIRADGAAYVCAGCDFRLGTKVASRTLTREEAETVLRGEKTALLDGFTSSKGKAFSAYLLWNEGEKKVVFEFPPREDSGHACPSCGKSLINRHGPAKGKKRAYNFWGCSGYPDCSVSLDDKGGVPDYASKK